MGTEGGPREVPRHLCLPPRRASPRNPRAQLSFICTVPHGCGGGKPLHFTGTTRVYILPYLRASVESHCKHYFHHCRSHLEARRLPSCSWPNFFHLSFIFFPGMAQSFMSERLPRQLACFCQHTDQCALSPRGTAWGERSLVILRSTGSR